MHKQSIQIHRRLQTCQPIHREDIRYHKPPAKKRSPKDYVFDAPWTNADHSLPSGPDNINQQARWCESEDEDANTMSYRKFVTPGKNLPS